MWPSETWHERQDGLELWDDIISMHLAARCSGSFLLLSYYSNHRCHGLKGFQKKIIWFENDQIHSQNYKCIMKLYQAEQNTVKLTHFSGTAGCRVKKQLDVAMFCGKPTTDVNVNDMYAFIWNWLVKIIKLKYLHVMENERLGLSSIGRLTSLKCIPMLILPHWHFYLTFFTLLILHLCCKLTSISEWE